MFGLFFSDRSCNRVEFSYIELSFLWSFFFLLMVTLRFYLFFCWVLYKLGFLIALVIFFYILFFSFPCRMSFRTILFSDLIGYGLCFLTVFIFIIMFLAGFFEFFKKNDWFFFLLLLISFLFFLIVVFLLGSFIVFYLFFELVVVPIFIMIIGWGYRYNRAQSSLYIFLYTFFSSLPLLIVLMYFNLKGVSFFFAYSFIVLIKEFFFVYTWVFAFFVFSVKLPVFILHLWLPKAHVDAPLIGSIILAGVLLKLGGYGLYKRIIYFFNDSFYLVSWFSIFSLWGGVLIAFLCVRQVDLKNLIAYSSVVHIGPVLACTYLISFTGFLGGYWIIFSHGLCSSCLFFLINLFYFNTNRRRFLLTKGLLFLTPIFSFIWFFFCILNIGFPPSFNFFSELFIMAGCFFFRRLFIFLLFFLLLVGGFYSIILYMRINHGQKKNFFVGFYYRSQDFLVVYLSFFVLMGFIFSITLFLC